MKITHVPEPLIGEIFQAGELAPAGVYRLVGTNVKVHLETEDYLPASEDGQTVPYERLHNTWEEYLDATQHPVV